MKPLAAITAESVWTCLKQTGTSGVWHFSPFSLAKQLKLCQVAWGSGVNISVKVEPQILNWIEIWVFTWPVQNIHLVVFQPSLCSFCCMFGAVLVKNKSSSCSSLADWIKLSSRICFCIHVPLDFYKPDVATTMLTMLRVIWSVSSDQMTFFQLTLEALTCLWANSRRNFMSTFFNSGFLVATLL